MKDSIFATIRRTLNPLIFSKIESVPCNAVHPCMNLVVLSHLEPILCGKRCYYLIACYSSTISAVRVLIMISHLTSFIIRCALWPEKYGSWKKITRKTEVFYKFLCFDSVSVGTEILLLRLSLRPLFSSCYSTLERNLSSENVFSDDKFFGPKCFSDDKFFGPNWFLVKPFFFTSHGFSNHCKSLRRVVKLWRYGCVTCGRRCVGCDISVLVVTGGVLAVAGGVLIVARGVLIVAGDKFNLGFVSEMQVGNRVQLHASLLHVMLHCVMSCRIRFQVQFWKTFEHLKSGLDSTTSLAID